MDDESEPNPKGDPLPLDDSPDTPVRVLFVCTANRARSPFAAVVTERRVHAQDLPVTVFSAGLQAFEGQPAMEPIERQASKFGADLTDHLSTPVTADLLERTDLVVAMTGRQILGLVDTFPTIQPRTITLREWARRSVEGDPIIDWTRPAVASWLTAVVDRPVSTLMSGMVDVADPVQRWPHRYGRTAVEIDDLIEMCIPSPNRPSPAEAATEPPEPDTPVWSG